MPDGNEIARTVNQDLATMRFEDALEVYSPNFAAVLPADVPLEHFKRMVVTAVNQNPDLRYADRRTLFNACVKCASDGVLPDGREAALVVFKTKRKDREGEEHLIDAVNYMIMVAGIRKRLRNTGEVLSAEAEVVYANDHFRFRLGDNATIEHEPAALDQEPGNVVGAYAIIRLVNGEVLREIVRLRDVERARQASKAPNSPAWKDWYDQMARKVALRRCAKAAPSSSSTMRAAQALERLLARDEEQPELPPSEELPAIPPRPRREAYATETTQASPEQTETDATRFQIVDAVGEVRGEYATEMEAIEELIALVGEMRSVASLEGLSENNPTLADFPSVIEAYKDQKEALTNSARAAGQTEHPEERQLATPTERSRAPQSFPQNTPSEVAPRDEPKTLTVTPLVDANGETDWTRTAAAMEARIATLTDPEDTAPLGPFHVANAKVLDDLWKKERKAWNLVNYRLGNRDRVLRGGES